jgi:hypothetical protein
MLEMGAKAHTDLHTKCLLLSFDLTKIIIRRQILVKGPSIKLHENSLTGSRVIT